MYSKVYVLDVRVRAIAGHHKMTEEDYGLPPGTLPPENVATRGQLKTVEKELLKAPERLRKRTDRALEKGVKVASGAVFTQDQLQPVLDDLNAIKRDYEDVINEICDKLEESVKACMKNAPNYADSIRKYAPTVNYIRRRMSYDINVYRMAVPTDDPHTDLLQQTLSRSSNDITARLIDEVAAEVSDFHKSSFVKTGKLVKQSVGTFRRKLLPKIQSFSLLDSTLQPIWAYLDTFVKDVISTIDSQPKGSKFIEGSELLTFEQRIKKLMTAEAMQALISAAPRPSGIRATARAPEPVASPQPARPRALPERPTHSESSQDAQRPLRRVSF